MLISINGNKPWLTTRGIIHFLQETIMAQTFNQRLLAEIEENIALLKKRIANISIFEPKKRSRFADVLKMQELARADQRLCIEFDQCQRF